MEKMEGSIVATYKYPHCTVYIHNGAYIGKTAEEKRQVCEEAKRIAGRIYIDALEREMERLHASGVSDDILQETAENNLVARVQEAKRQRNIILWGTPEGGDPIVT